MDKELDAPNIGANLGMTSQVIGIIAILFFFLPILGIPTSIFGLAFGILGLILALFNKNTCLRWSLLGIGISTLALMVNLIIGI